MTASEDHRSRVRAWARDSNDEALAECFMSHIAPASLADVVTKEVSHGRGVASGQQGGAAGFAAAVVLVTAMTAFVTAA